MIDLEEWLGDVLEKYYPLYVLNPKNELLKYFILDINGFRRNQDEEIKEEFLEKFRGNFPTRNDLEGGRVEMSFLEYGRRLVSSLLQNYCNALEEELKIVELRN